MPSKTEAMSEALRERLVRIQRLRKAYKDDLNARGQYLLARCERSVAQEIQQLEEEKYAKV